MGFEKGFWKPNPKQALFLSLPYTVFEALYGGGVGSGKSDVLLLYGIMHGWYNFPSWKQVFTRRTYPELKNEIVPRSREIYPKFGATFNKTDMTWTFPRPDQIGSGMPNAGALIILGHCENEDDVHNYDSTQISLYTPDEITSNTEWIYTYLAFQRTRSADPDNYPALVRAAGMPGNIGHRFVKKRFIDPKPEGGEIIIGKGGIKRFYVHSTVEDNKDGDPAYAARLDGITNEAERKAKKYGDWNAYKGQVFDEFRTRHFVTEPENALHVIPPFEIPDWWPKMVIGDWGFAAMTYIGFYAISPTKRVYLYRELTYLKTKISTWGPEVKAFIDKEHPRCVKFCRSAAQDRGTEHTVQQQIEEALGCTIELSDNIAGSRVAGKMLVHEYLRWEQKPTVIDKEIPEYNPEHAQWLLRNRGLEDYKAYLAIFDPPENELNLPKLQIFCCEEEHHDGHPNCCPEMINSIQACNYDKKNKDGKPAEDVAEFDGDDPYDDLRYALDSAERWFEDSVREFEKLQRQQAIITALQNTGNFTAYYRSMAAQDNQNQMKSARRFRRR